jgi:hypothetical protein
MSSVILGLESQFFGVLLALKRKKNVAYHAKELE